MIFLHRGKYIFEYFFTLKSAMNEIFKPAFFGVGRHFYVGKTSSFWDRVLSLLSKHSVYGVA